MKLNKNVYYREEVNGLSVYRLQENDYHFFKNVGADYVDKLCENIALLDSSLELDLTAPLCVCCLAENTCNLNCKYCFGDDKMYSTKRQENIEQIYSPLVDMHPVQISLGGGEPTLNPRLGEIIDYIASHDIAVLLDTNGTTATWNKLIPVIQKNDVLVRFSIDSINDSTINQVRPYKKATDISMAQVIDQNIDYLLANNVMVSVQTVLTRINWMELADIAEYLIKKGIPRWHISCVKYSEKCKNYYDDLRITKEIVDDALFMLARYADLIDITLAFEEDYGKNARLLFDVNGQFLTDSITDGLNYLGASPSQEELYHSLDKQAHIKRYLGNFYIKP